MIRRVALVIALWTADAHAMSCIDHAYETMQIELALVRSDGHAVERPSELVLYDEILNSGHAGKGILMWEKKHMGLAKFYKLDKPMTPVPEVAAYIDAKKQDSLSTACGYDVDYTPILPGRYPFFEEHSDGSKTSKVLGSPVLTVAPGRGEVLLGFDLAGKHYEATYRVVCAYFDWGKRSSCAPQSGALASKIEPPPQAAPISSGPPLVIGTPPPVARGGGCACHAAGTNSGNALGVLALLIWRRCASGARARARSARSRSCS